MSASPAPAVDPSCIAAVELRRVIERIERQEEERAALAGDIERVYVEAEADGFDLRKRDHEGRQDAAVQLRGRIERLEEEKAGIAGDIRAVYARAKANGFDVKVLRKVIALRKRDHDERLEEAAILELYLQALGMVQP